MLLTMTLIAVSMVDGAILQELMAGNSRQKTVSRYVAESALNEAEKTIVTKNFSVASNMAPLFDSTIKGYYSAVNISLAPGISKTAVPVDFDITDMLAWNNSVNSIAVPGVIDTAITAKAPQYIIEYIGRQQPDSKPVPSLERDDADQSRLFYFFRVVAIGWGKEPEIYTILQSTYRLKSTMTIGDKPNTVINGFYGDSHSLTQTKTETVKSAATRDNGRISWSIIY